MGLSEPSGGLFSTSKGNGPFRGGAGGARGCTMNKGFWRGSFINRDTSVKGGGFRMHQEHTNKFSLTEEGLRKKERRIIRWSNPQTTKGKREEGPVHSRKKFKTFAKFLKKDVRSPKKEGER